MARDPFAVFEHYLEYLDSHDGRIDRVKKWNERESEYDHAGTIYGAILTVGDLRALVEAGREWRAAREGEKADGA